MEYIHISSVTYSRWCSHFTGQTGVRVAVSPAELRMAELHGLQLLSISLCVSSPSQNSAIPVTRSDVNHRVLVIKTESPKTPLPGNA